MSFQTGDRVRIKAVQSEYTGCRGTVTADPAATEQGVLPFGYYVAIDGETGAPRPFLIEDLERVQGASVRPVAVDQKTTLTRA